MRREAGEGLRNDAIAGRLFIAPGTVKVHLSHIFAKLGITTRAELAAQVASHDLTARLSREQTAVTWHNPGRINLSVPGRTVRL